MLVQLCYDYDALIKKKDIYRKHQPYKLHRKTILRFLNDDMPIDCKTYRFLHVYIAMWQPENRMSYVFQQHYRENENSYFIFTQVTLQRLQRIIRREIFYFLHHVY